MRHGQRQQPHRNPSVRDNDHATRACARRPNPTPHQPRHTGHVAHTTTGCARPIVAGKAARETAKNCYARWSTDGQTKTARTNEPVDSTPWCYRTASRASPRRRSRTCSPACTVLNTQASLVRKNPRTFLVDRCTWHQPRSSNPARTAFAPPDNQRSTRTHTRIHTVPDQLRPKMAIPSSQPADQVACNKRSKGKKHTQEALLLGWTHTTRGCVKRACVVLRSLLLSASGAGTV